MSLILALVFGRFLNNLRIPFVLSLLFYGGTAEYWAYHYKEYSLLLLGYLVVLALLLFVFCWAANDIGRNGVPGSVGAHLVFFIITALLAFYFVRRDYGGLGNILNMNRASFYLLRQEGNPLFDVCLFSALSQFAILYRKSSRWLFFIILLPLVFLVLSLGDRRILLLLIFPLIYRSGNSIYSTRTIVIVVFTTIFFLLTGIWRINNSFDFSFLQSVEIVKLLIPNESWLVYGIFNDIYHDVSEYMYGFTYIEGLLLMIPDFLWDFDIEPLSKWYVRIWHHELWKNGNTVAFSIVGELFLNWGLLFALGFLPIIFISRLLAHVLNQIYGYIWPSIFAYWVFILPRLSFSNILKDFSFLLIIWIILMFIKSISVYVRDSGNS